MKKIAVNTRHLIKNEMDGIGLFTSETFKILVKKHPDIVFVFIFDRKPHPEFITQPNVQFKVISPPLRHIALFKYWYQTALKNYLKKINADIFIGTDGMMPLKSDTKSLAVIHDLNFEHHPDFLPKNVLEYYKKWMPQFAQKANRITTVSEFSKQDLIKTYKIDSSKIDIVYNGANENFKPISPKEKTSIQHKYSESKPFFLFVGTLHPRKNLIHLFKAFEEFKTESNSDLKLLVVGKKMWWTKEIEETYNQLKFKQDVIFTGRVSENELNKIMAAAFALTYLPFFEGFGIPLVEAMKCGIPIITSNVTSMPEVVGDAGILVNPNSTEEITNAMVKITSDEKLRLELIEKSKVQSQKFSWEKTGDLLWKSILKTIDA